MICQKCTLFTSISPSLTQKPLNPPLTPSVRGDFSLCLHTEPTPHESSPFLLLSHFHSTPALYHCVELIIFCIGNPYEKGKGGKIRSRSCHSHLIICGHAEEAKLAQGFLGSSTIFCLKDEDDHRSSWSDTFVSSLSFQGSSSSKKTSVGKIIPFAEAPALLCKDNSRFPEKKLWFIAALLNFSLNLIWAQCDKILAHWDNNIIYKT